MPWLSDAYHAEFFRPSTLPGAVLWAVVFAIVAFYIARLAKLGFVRLMASDSGDRNVLLFLSQLAKVIIYILALVFYVHLVPALNALGTALLSSASIVSVVVGLAAQPTLPMVPARWASPCSSTAPSTSATTSR
jgi:small conductance mechanosensitive channel